jgi:hypothetical protein
MGEAAGVHLIRGSLHLPAAVYGRYFAGLESVVLLRRNDDLVILPVRHAAAGGYLLKRRNALGDRVVHAGDFFREQGLEDAMDRPLTVAWESELAGLRASGVFVQL